MELRKPKRNQVKIKRNQEQKKEIFVSVNLFQDKGCQILSCYFNDIVRKFDAFVF